MYIIVFVLILISSFISSFAMDVPKSLCPHRAPTPELCAPGSSHADTRPMLVSESKPEPIFYDASGEFWHEAPEELLLAKKPKSNCCQASVDLLKFMGKVTYYGAGCIANTAVAAVCLGLAIPYCLLTSENNQDTSHGMHNGNGTAKIE